MMHFKPMVKKVGVAPEQELRVSWGNGYPAILLGEPGQQIDLPGSEAWIEARDLKEKKDIVILGERSCGVQDFLDWCSDQLEDDHWLFLQGGAWMESLSRVSNSAEFLKKSAFEALHKMSREKGADCKANALIEWAGELEADVHLIIREFSALGPEDSLEVARAFRLIRDNHKCPRLHILIGSSSESYLTDDLFSNFLPMTYRYRMRPLDKESMCLLMGKSLKKGGDIPGNVLERMEQIVGGQRFLMQRLLHRLTERLRGRHEIGVRDLEEAFRQEKRSPPPVARSWQRDLANILSRNGELFEPMRSYVGGFTLGPGKMPPSDSERPLFVAGWLRKQWDGRWGIASEMHAALARPVLDAPAKFLKTEGHAQ